jgi:hypothetical protein
MADPDIRSPAPFGTWFGVVLLFVLFGAIVLAIIGPSPRGNDYEQKRAEAREKKLKDLREEDAKALTTYSWIDKTKGSVRIPIERAMQLTLADLANKKPAPAYPIATPAPENVAAPSGPTAASPAPATMPQPRQSPKATSVEGPKSESRGQPAAATNPPGAQPATQPGPAATPAASPKSSAAVAPVSPSPAQIATPPGSPLPVRGASPSPSQ